MVCVLAQSVTFTTAPGARHNCGAFTPPGMFQPAVGPCTGFSEIGGNRMGETLILTRVPRLLIGLVLISIELSSLSGSPARGQAGSDAGASDEEYEIYSAVIKQYYVDDKTKLLVIVDRTFKYDFGDNEEPWKDKYKGLTIDRSTVEDYEARNVRPSLLNKAPFKLTGKFSLISDLDLKAIFHGSWGELQWIAYYRRFAESRGFIMLSRIGFNTEHTQALLYVGSRCGPGCGDIHFLLLEKTNGTWTTKKELKKKNMG